MVSGNKKKFIKKKTFSTGSGRITLKNSVQNYFHLLNCYAHGEWK